MVCYARPAGCFAAIVAVAWLVFAGPVSHQFGHAATLVAIIAATLGTAVAAALAFAIFMATRRHRAATGGCVSCRFQCQHAMTEETSGPVPHARERGVATTRSVPVLLPMPAVRVAATSAPRWPDRPIHSTQRDRAAACSVSS
ncbi:MAG: hypothetical protein ABSB59_21465 [Streptosporangiaceae bacterium]|jgi:hypothetical protein